jgi:hypothetical protein
VATFCSPSTLLGYVPLLGGGDGRHHRDWFAVTALFRRPLGCPFRTAIVPRRRTIGASLARFVRDHFLNRDALSHARTR